MDLEPTSCIKRIDLYFSRIAAAHRRENQWICGIGAARGGGGDGELISRPASWAIPDSFKPQRQARSCADPYWQLMS